MITFYKLKEEDLKREEIKMALSQGRVMLMVENNNMGRQRMIEKAYRMIKPAQGYINRNYNLNSVRLCLDAFAEDMGEDFTLQMQSVTKCERLLCMMVGAMLAVGVFTNTAAQLAGCLELDRNSRNSARCRIDEGKRNERLVNILQGMEKSVRKCQATFA